MVIAPICTVMQDDTILSIAQEEQHILVLIREDLTLSQHILNMLLILSICPIFAHRLTLCSTVKLTMHRNISAISAPMHSPIM